MAELGYEQICFRDHLKTYDSSIVCSFTFTSHGRMTEEGDDYINAAHGSRSPAQNRFASTHLWVGLKPCRDAQSRSPPLSEPIFSGKSIIVSVKHGFRIPKKTR